jgi:hypothetical protein
MDNVVILRRPHAGQPALAPAAPNQYRDISRQLQTGRASLEILWDAVATLGRIDRALHDLSRSAEAQIEYNRKVLEALKSGDIGRMEKVRDEILLRKAGAHTDPDR